MTPITGPYDRVINGQNGKSYKYRRSYRQRKPYGLPLPFDSHGRNILKKSNASGFYDTTALGATCNPAWMQAGFPNGETAEGTKEFLRAISITESTARERFNSKLRDQAEIGASLAQAKQSVDMIQKRSQEIFHFARALKRFDFVRAGQLLGQVVYGKERQYYRQTPQGPKPLRLRRNARAFSSNFLEYSFGWAPLVGDIGSAIDIIGSPNVGNVDIRGGAKTVDTYSKRVYAGAYQGQQAHMSGSHKFTVIATCRANVKVANPNTSLAAQLGLVNPATVLWEIVPFSFVVDYFVNVQSYLENYTSTLGLELSNVQSTTYVKDHCTGIQTWTGSLNFPANLVVSDYYRHTRKNSLPEVKLRLKEVTLPIGRALTSISLLVSLGIKKK